MIDLTKANRGDKFICRDGREVTYEGFFEYIRCGKHLLSVANHDRWVNDDGRFSRTEHSDWDIVSPAPQIWTDEPSGFPCWCKMGCDEFVINQQSPYYSAKYGPPIPDPETCWKLANGWKLVPGDA